MIGINTATKRLMVIFSVELSETKGRVIWALERYSLHHDIEGSDSALCFYGWLLHKREDLVDYKNAYQQIKAWVEEFKTQ